MLYCIFCCVCRIRNSPPSERARRVPVAKEGVSEGLCIFGGSGYDEKEMPSAIRAKHFFCLTDLPSTLPFHDDRGRKYRRAGVSKTLRFS